MWKLKEGEHLEDLSVSGRVILKLFLNRSKGQACAGLIWMGVGTSDGMF